MAKDKVILVASPLGRMGTSATMGLLWIARADIGHPVNITKATSMNPKGFFELKSFRKFMKTTFGKFYSRDVMQVPTIKQLDDLGDRWYNKFYNLIRSEFPSFPAAVKAQRYLTVPLFHRLRDRFDVKILSMHRTEENQAQSIIRMWKKSKHPYENLASIGFIKKSIRVWKKLVGAIRKRYSSFDYMDVHFEKLLEYPVKTANEITEFVGMPRIKPKQVRDWIDKRLVNRVNI